MADNSTVKNTNVTGKPTGKPKAKAAAKKRTKVQMLNDKKAYLRLQEILQAERARDRKSEVLIIEFERIEAELKEQIFQDALGA